MPYIKPEDRLEYDGLINKIVERLVNKLPGDNGRHYNEGELNYIISSIVWKLFDKRRSYGNGNTLVGVLECVKQEFIRRKLSPYEDEKIKENGDLT